VCKNMALLPVPWVPDGAGSWWMPCAGSGLAGAGGVAAGAGGVACFQVGAGCFPRPPIVPRAPAGVKALRPLQGGPCGPGLDPGRCPPGIGSDQGKGGRRLNGACRSRAVACGLSNSHGQDRRERHAEFKAMGADAGCRKRHRDRGDQPGGKSRAGRRAGDHGNRPGPAAPAQGRAVRDLRAPLPGL
jgi:hypothetical protein